MSGMRRPWLRHRLALVTDWLVSTPSRAHALRRRVRRSRRAFVVLILEDAVAAAGGLFADHVDPDHAFRILHAESSALVRVSAGWQVRRIVVTTAKVRIVHVQQNLVV